MRGQDIRDIGKKIRIQDPFKKILLPVHIKECFACDDLWEWCVQVGNHNLSFFLAALCFTSQPGQSYLLNLQVTSVHLHDKAESFPCQCDWIPSIAL